MILAPFYAPRPEHARHTYDFIDCLRLQRAACARFGLAQVVISDTPLPCPPLAAVLRCALPGDLMPAILEGQRQLLAHYDDGREDIILTGADCLPGRDLAGLFDGSFDILMTTHPFPDCILNTGLIAVAGHAARPAARLWGAALAVCGPAWGEDQLALARIFAPTLEHGIHVRRGMRVKFVPCVGWNWAPEHEAEPCDARIVHFRGPRKRWMRAWAGRFA